MFLSEFQEVEWVNYDLEDTTVWNQYDDAPDGNVGVEEADNGWYGEVAEPVSKRQKVTPTPRPPSLPPPGMSRDTSSNDENEKAMLAAEHEEWAQRCAIDPARPGQPLRLTILMAEALLRTVRCVHPTVRLFLVQSNTCPRAATDEILACYCACSHLVPHPSSSSTVSSVVGETANRGFRMDNAPMMIIHM